MSSVGATLVVDRSALSPAPTGRGLFAGPCTQGSRSWPERLGAPTLGCNLSGLQPEARRVREAPAPRYMQFI